MRTTLLAAGAMIAAVIGTPITRAADYTVGPLTIEQPWARASVAANGAAYMTISTAGSEADQLVAATSPVADKVELHTHIVEGDVMRMRPVKAIDVNIGEPAVLKPGGLHVMLIGLKGPLKQGERFPLTLTFEKAGSVTVDVDVEAIGAATSRGARGH
jgi:hypothetical protein